MFFEKKTLFCLCVMLLCHGVVSCSDEQNGLLKKIEQDNKPTLHIQAINFSFLHLPHNNSNPNNQHQGHATLFTGKESLIKKLVAVIKVALTDEQYNVHVYKFHGHKK